MYDNKCARFIVSLSPAIISLLCSIAAYYFDIVLICVPTDDSFHFNLITVNALFGGFLYTNYSLLLGILDTKVAKKVANTNIIPKRNTHILRGIVYSTLSVLSGLYVVFTHPNNEGMFGFLYCLMINAEGMFMLFLILYFLLSLNEMNQLLSKIHTPDGNMSRENVQQLKHNILNDSFDSPPCE